MRSLLAVTKRRCLIMYREFYGMKHQPFSRNVPSEALYESKAMTEALGRLAYVADRQLFAVVTADAGCGKSTLIRKFASSLPKEKYIFLYLSVGIRSKILSRGCQKTAAKRDRDHTWSS